MPAVPIVISSDIDFGSRVSALIAVGNAVNANLTYWGATVTAVPRVAVPSQGAANSPRRSTGQLNSLAAAVGGAYTAFAMAPAGSVVKTHTSSDYESFQSHLAAIVAQHNLIVTAHA
jgi:hypothetical protein